MVRTITKLIVIFILLNFCIFISSKNIYAKDIETQIEKIQKAYENIKSISGKFTQKSYIKDLNRTDNYKGKFFIKRPMKLKWEYEGKNPQEIYINNNEITIYQKKEKQAIKGNFNKETYGQAPVVLLSGFGNVKEEFNISSKNNSLILKPKKPLGSVNYIELEITDDNFPILSFVIYDNHSNKTSIVLKDVEINKDLDDSIFKPILSKDITIFTQ